MFEDVRRAGARLVRRWPVAALVLGLTLVACDDAPATTSTLDRVRRAPEVVGKGLQSGLALTGPTPRLRDRPLDDDAALRRVVDLAWRTKAQPTEGVRQGLLALARASTEPPRVTVDDETRGSVSFHGAVPNPHGNGEGAAEIMARRWFASLSLAPGRGLFLRARGRERGDAGDLHLMFDVVMPAPDHDPEKARPVWNVALHAHFAADATLTALHGTGLLPIDPPDAVRLDGEAAQRAAARALALGDEAPRALGAPVLGVWRGLAETGRGAWAFQVEHARGQEVFASFVDARDGAVLATHPLSHSETAAGPTVGSASDYRGTPIPVRATYVPSTGLYTLVDQSQPARGRILTYDGDNHKSVGATFELMSSSALDAWDVAGATAHHHARLTLDYLWNVHGRKSWDGRGGDLHVVVHVGDRLENAYFVSSGAYASLRFGDGVADRLFDTAGCLDIVAHELGHGVISTSAPLVYMGMSGALNESIADVFAVLVDSANWTLAEHCVGPRYRYLRDMANPVSRGQPAHMLDYKRMPNDYAGDYGGVHFNSGIPSRAAYLLARARDRETLGRVWYQTLQGMYIEPNATFQRMALGTLDACDDLIAAGRAVRADCDAVAAAWAEVGIAVLKLGSLGACPAHARVEGGLCICDDDRTPSRDGTACLPLASYVCSENSRVIEGECECAEGFRSVHAKCTSDPRACPANSAYDELAGDCLCSEGFEGDPFASTGCVVIPSTCPRNAHPEWEGEREENPAGYACVCNAGYERDPAAGECARLPDSCGSETYRGRCEGDKLVYCAASGLPASTDCAAEGFACGLVDAEHGYDCLNPSGLPAGSACNPSRSQECDDDSPLCVARRGEQAGFCSFACETGADCPRPFACCAPIGDGTRACQLESYCASARDPRSVCTDVAGSSAFGSCVSDARVTYCDPALRATVETDCAERGQVCGLESAEAGYACVDAPRPTRPGTDGCATAGDGVCDVPARCPEGSDTRDCHPCGDVGAAGRCSGTMLEVCDAALGLARTDCAALAGGLACDVVDGVAACRAPIQLSVREAGDPESAGGCSSRGGAPPDPRVGVAWLLALAALARRRRQRLVK